MDLSIPPALIYVASWLSLTGGVWALFDRAEAVATEEAKRAISRWLRNLDPGGPLAPWPTAFAAVFDRVFGARHLSWRCFLRSCVASVASVAIVTLLWVVVRRDEASLFLDTLGEGLLLGLAVLLATLAINTVPDYLSLLETRYVLHWMGLRPSLGRILGLLALDCLVTALLAAAVILLFASRVNYTVSGQVHRLDSLATVRQFLGTTVLPLTAERGVPILLQVTIDVPASRLKSAAAQIEAELSAPPGRRPPAAQSQPTRAARRGEPPLTVRISGPPWGIFFYSTFFTSVWVWLYALAGGLLKLAQALGVAWRGLRWLLDIEQKPLRSMGLVANLLITLVYLVMPIVR